jgi:tetratricopeptide (TPR) repeat protein
VFQFDKRTLLTVCIVFVVALGVRIVHLESIKSNPFFNNPTMDEKYHDEWAQEIAHGSLFARTPFYRAPAYPFLLGSIYAIFGQGYYAPRLIGIIIGALSCIFIYLLGNMMFSHRVGLLSALLACFYGMFLYFDSMLLTTYLEVFFYLLGVLYLCKWMKEKKNVNLAIAGIFWGLASITRPNFLVIIPVFAVFVFMTYKWSIRQSLNAIFTLLAAMIPVVLIVTLINIFAGKDFVLLAWNGGINFYLGNNPFADGWSATSPELDATWWGGYRDAILVAEQATGKELLPSQVSSYWFGRGLEYIFARPISWLALMLKKLYLLFNAFDLSNNQSIQAFKDYSPLLRIPLFDFSLILAFAIWGIVVSLRSRWTKLILSFLVFYGLSIVFFFVTTRYRIPLVPLLLILASYAVFWIIEKAKAKQPKGVILSVVLIVAIGAFCHTDFYGTHVIDYCSIHISQGNRFFAIGDFQKAHAEYSEALTKNPNNVDAINALGNTYMMLKRNDDAKQLFVRSLDLTNTTDALCKLGVIHLQSGALDSAHHYLAAAIAVDSTNPEAYYYMGIFHAYGQQSDSAIKCLETSLSYYPEPQYRQNIHVNLGRLYLELGNINKAKEHFMRAGLRPEDIPEILGRPR